MVVCGDVRVHVEVGVVVCAWEGVVCAREGVVVHGRVWSAW